MTSSVSPGGRAVGATTSFAMSGRELGISEVLWRIAMRPGKPLAFGVRESIARLRTTRESGVESRLLRAVRAPGAARIAGRIEREAGGRTGSLSSPVVRNAQRDHLMRVRLSASGGAIALTPLLGQESHQIAITAQADGLAWIPRGAAELPAGSEVAYLPL